MRRVLLALLAVAAGLLVVLAEYWAVEYYLVWDYARQTVAAAEQLAPSDVDVIEIQLLGSYPWTKPLQYHSWLVVYQDPRFRAQGFPKNSGNVLHVEEPAFGDFSSFTIRSSPPR